MSLSQHTFLSNVLANKAQINQLCYVRRFLNVLFEMYFFILNHAFFSLNHRHDTCKSSIQLIN